MQTSPRREVTRSPSSLNSRSNSFSSDASPSSRRPSVYAMFPRLRPAPAYVALAAASQLATENQMLREHIELEEEGALFSQGALAMINGFLDQILYNLLHSSQSTSLNNLRLAVDLVLKGKLARFALLAANDELDQLLTDEEKGIAADHDETDGTLKENVDTIFKRMRLRIMVYSRLGEMEDEEEEAYLKDESLWDQDDMQNIVSESMGLLSAANILLTAVLEYLAEQCIDVATTGAHGRLVSKRSGKSTPTFGLDGGVSDSRLMIDEQDVEKIALNSTLGRLWRTWRRGCRTARPNISKSSTPIPMMLSSQSYQIFHRTPSTTLRPLLASAASQDVQAKGGLTDMSDLSKQSAQPRTPRRSLERFTNGNAGRHNQSSEEEPNGGKKRSQPKTHQDMPAQTMTNGPNGQSCSPNPPPHGTATAEPHTHIHVGQSHNAELPSFGSPAEIKFTPDPHGMDSTESMAVPVSGVLHFQFSQHGLMYRNSRASTYGVVDEKSSPANRIDITDHPEQQMDNIETPAKEIHFKTDEISENDWQNDVSNTYQPSTTTAAGPAAVPSVQEKHQRITRSAESSHENNITMHFPVTNERFRQQGRPTTLPRIVTATAIATSSDDGYTATPISAEPTGASREPVTPVADDSDTFHRSPNQDLAFTKSQALVRDTFIAREPRIKTESTRDFADFIRSTAPTVDQTRVIPLLTPAPPPLSNVPKSAASSAPAREARPIAEVNDVASNMESNEKIGLYTVNINTPSSMIRLRNPSLQPRDPVNRGRSNDELIAFLREGPPGARNSTPTLRENLERRTADKFNIATSPLRTSDLTMNSHLGHESLNSNSALLTQGSLNVPSNPATRAEHPTYENVGLTGPQTTILQPGPRKQRRVKDPYAIPSDDEDEDILTALPRKGQVDENLIDFLKTTGPSDVNDRISQDGMPYSGEYLSARTSLQIGRTSSDIDSYNRTTKPKQDGKSHAVRDFWRKISA